MEVLLKEISLEGFKSFRDRTVLKFDGLMTAIVGPNGSGKSNVVDAVKWVLGDPSPRSIRASSGLEAIYRPSDGESGDGAGFCAVGLKIDNPDCESGDEPATWEIERRYYRSGESVYTINGRTARLKDVRSIMARMGFGLGSLSVVGQGEIEGFLSLVPQDRRLVFEDLARISDFKANKRRTLGQLEECSRNLERMRDLIGEIGSRAETLSVQADAARRHAELVRERDEIQAQLAALEYLLARRNIERHESRLDDLRNELEEAVAKARELSDALSSSRKALEDARSRCQATLAECEEKRRELDRAGMEERRLTDVQQHLAALLKSLDEAVAECGGRLEKLQRRQDELREVARGAVEERVAAWRRRLEYELYLSRRWGYMRACERERERLAARVERVAGEGTLFARDAEFHLRRAEAVQGSLDDLSVKKLRLLEEVDTLETQGVEMEQEYDHLMSRRAEEKGVLRRTLESLIEAREAREAAGKRRTEVASEIAALEREREVLVDLESSREGYADAVKAMLERRNEFDGLRGSLGELIQVEQGMEETIEQALGEALQFLVCDTLQQALKVVETVRADNLGTVTCLVRELVPESGVGQGEGNLLRACTVEPALQPMLALLLKGAKKVDSLSALEEQALERILVASDGSVFRPPAFVSGGSEGSAAEGILSRRGRIQELDGLIADRKEDAGLVEEEIVRIAEQVAHAEKGYRSANSALDELSDRLHETADTRSVNSARRRQIRAELESLEESIGKLEGEREACIHTAKLAARSEEAVKRVRAGAQEDLERIEGEIPRMNAQIEDLRARLQRAILEEASYGEEAERARAEIARLEEEIGVLTREEEAKRRRLEEVSGQASSASEDLARVVEAHKALSESLPELEEKEKQAAESIQSLVGEVSEAEETLEAARENASRLETAVHSQEVRLAELRGGLGSLEKGLDSFPEFAGSIRSGELSGRDIPSRKELVERLEVVTQDLEELGEVNPLAIQEERLAKDRLDELRSEREDLISAEGELREALEEIERESKKAFVSTFDEARKRFSEVFGSLFPGGSGELSLTDPDDPLESGIDVRVRFPGKAEMDLLQFSGGERALIALALLFAILKVKPSSFTILDEVEAALDDPNTQKFLDYLGQEFPDRQFVLITHNKLTMEHADRLYGVTLREGGVSQVVSVDLKRLKEEGVEEVLGAAS